MSSRHRGRLSGLESVLCMALVVSLMGCATNGGIKPSTDPTNPSNDHRLGACCYTDGSCSVLTSNQCQRQGNLWKGPDTQCSPNPCVGACCHTQDGRCFIRTADQCRELLSWQGVGTSCSPNPCQPAETGACCRFAGQCIEVSEVRCSWSHGYWVGSSCSPNPCANLPSGACCKHDGSCEEMVVTTCVSGEVHGWTYMGHYTTCDPDPCR